MEKRFFEVHIGIKNEIRFINKSVDPFLMQIVVVPVIAIGVGGFVAVKTRLYLIAPVITFLLSFISNIFFLNIVRYNLVGNDIPYNIIDNKFII